MLAPASIPAASAASVRGAPVGRRAARDRAEEVLARDRQQHGMPERAHGVEPPQHRDGLRRRLGEVGARVEHDLPLPHPARARHRDALGQEADDVLDHVVVGAGIEQRPLRLDPRVHDHERRAGARADVGERRVAQARDVVDHARARRDRRLRDLRLVGVDRDEHVVLGDDPLDQRHHALDLLGGGDGRAHADRRLAADVDDRRARRHVRGGAGGARLEVGQLAGVGERVGRRVDDAHQQRRAGELELPAARPQPHEMRSLTIFTRRLPALVVARHAQLEAAAAVAVGAAEALAALAHGALGVAVADADLRHARALAVVGARRRSAARGPRRAGRETLTLIFGPWLSKRTTRVRLGVSWPRASIAITW